MKIVGFYIWDSTCQHSKRHCLLQKNWKVCILLRTKLPTHVYTNLIIDMLLCYYPVAYHKYLFNKTFSFFLISLVIGWLPIKNSYSYPMYIYRDVYLLSSMKSIVLKQNVDNSVVKLLYFILDNL